MVQAVCEKPAIIQFVNSVVTEHNASCLVRRPL